MEWSLYAAVDKQFTKIQQFSNETVWRMP